MPWSVEQIAEELRRRLPSASVTSVHKLLYFCQGHHLQQFHEPLFAQRISAWDHGPVVSALYGAEKHGAAFIPRLPAEALDEGALNTIGYVISRYGRLSARDLVDLTHAQAPWRDVYRVRSEREAGSETISIDALEAFFSRAEEPVDEQSDGGNDQTADERRLDPTVIAAYLAARRPDTAPVPSGRDDGERLRELAAST